MQRGQVFKRGKVWQVRYYVDGQRKQKGGFLTKPEATVWLEEEVLKYDRLGTLADRLYRPRLTVDQVFDEFLAQHQADPVTIRTLTVRLVYARRAFGDTLAERLAPRTVATWRVTLPERSAYGIMQALRQALAWAVAVKLIDSNPARAIPNPQPGRGDHRPFDSYEELDRLGIELDEAHRGLPTFAAASGLRPEEWAALERPDVDRKNHVIHVCRVLVDGHVKLIGKTDRSLRRVPLTKRAADALDLGPARLDTRILFPGSNGKHLDMHNWRHREWHEALEAGGFYTCQACEQVTQTDLAPRGSRGCPGCGLIIKNRRPYDLRHTFATFAIAAGVSMFHLARFMGTSIEMIDKHYGHLFPDAEDQVRAQLDSWDVEQDELAKAVEA